MKPSDRLDVEVPVSFTDDELAALALAAGSSEVVCREAVSVWEFLGTEAVSPLPSWYMPAPMGARRLSG
jgi:hypothetical protein